MNFKISMKYLFILLNFSILISSHAKDVELSWEKAPVYVKDSFFSKSTSKIDLDKKYPAVIYLHGCTGIFPQHDIGWAKLLASNNMVVVLPDSMARPNRKSNCDPRLRGGTNIFPQAYEYRQQEISYAKEQITKSEWWDGRNLFLMGHSEGGIATAQALHNGLSGVIISGWTCTHRSAPSFDGIYSSKDIPVLAIAFLDDSWRKGKVTEGRCADKADGRNLIQIDLIGSEHSTYESKQARDAVIEFINKNLK
jgi:dienelactone hydrolase